MSVATVKDRLIEICQSIEGINDAGRTPRNVANPDFPFVIVLAGDAETPLNYSSLGDEYALYRLLLVVKSWSQGVEYEAEELCEPFFERFRTEFMGNRSLYGDDNEALRYILDSQLIRRTGVIEIVLAGVSYAGVEFTLQIREQFSICQR